MEGNVVPFTIMCFTWNASGLRLCETLSQDKANLSRKGFFVTKKPCLTPNFFEEIRIAINTRQPGLVVMSTQDEDSNDTYFHSKLLPNSMTEIGYSLLKRDKLDGVGEAASGVVLTRVPTGTPSGSALRISIYARNEIIKDLHVENIHQKGILNFFSRNNKAVSTKTTCVQGNRISGAIATYVWHDMYGKFVFIATHLPSGVKPLRIRKDLDYQSYRAASKSANNICLIKLYNEFITSISQDLRPDHIFLLGDLNYDIVIPDKRNVEIISELASNLSAAKLKSLQKFDELNKAMEDVPLNGFKEGVSAEGPLFMPTWRLARGRRDACSPSDNINSVQTSCFGAPNDELGSVGWHDRILYKELMTSNYIAHCTDYNRIDIKNIHASTNAGVLGFFEMLPII